MKTKTYFILLIYVLALAACSEDIMSDAASEGAVEISRINASVENGATTRAAGVVYLEDRISRYQFVSADRMTFTKIQRTDHPISRFQYKGVAFNCNASGAWERDKNTGSSMESSVPPERIYWSDATSAHTFVGFSLPKDNSNFDWKKSEYYYDNDDAKKDNETYYGAIGNPLAATEVIDYNPASPTTETITVTVDGKEQPLTFGYSQKLRDEDLLLTHDINLKADNSVANIKYYHALSSVRIIVNISGFYGTATDAYSKVSDMVLHNQPTLYRWIQESAAVEALLSEQENQTLKQTGLWGETNAPAYNQRKDMKLWNTNPEGEGQGASKLFTFYGITVPQGVDYFSKFTGTEYGKLKMSFKVTYPDPLKNDPVEKTITKKYTAEINKPVYFYPGKCTTINITLNHRDETMTVGASYQDWEYIDSPDEGVLKKKTTFLSKAPALADRDQARVTIVGDDQATADDATWLYERKDNNGASLGIFDIYGNDGSATSPFTISTANQLLSFAYEVKSGRSFEHQYVKLDADITLQPSASLPTKKVDDVDVLDESKLISWIGIGDDTHAFNGIFLGSGRHINNLYGEHFFHTVGDNAVIDKLNFDNIVEVKGCGVIAHENNGLICSCYIDGDVKETATACTSYTGSIVGTNNSFIIACAHVGNVTGYGKVGGLVGFNNGTVMASYHSGEVKVVGSGEVHPTVGKIGKSDNTGENDSYMFSCYYDKNVFTDNRTLEAGRLGYPFTTTTMQSNGFANSIKTYVFEDATGAYSQTNGKTIKQVLMEVLNVTEEPTGATVDAKIKNLMAQLIAYDKDAQNVAKKSFKLFEYHFSLNEALTVFRYWLEAINNATGTGESVSTNCHTFSKDQIEFLYNHYGAEHKYVYAPATYPKIQ